MCASTCIHACMPAYVFFVCCCCCFVVVFFFFFFFWGGVVVFCLYEWEFVKHFKRERQTNRQNIESHYIIINAELGRKPIVIINRQYCVYET